MNLRVKSTNFLLSLFIGLCFTFCISENVLAQLTPVSGTITYKASPEVAAVPRADVEIIILRKDMKQQFKTKTDKRGRYFYSLPAYGTYVITAYGQGLTAQIGRAFQLRGEAPEINFEVVPGNGSRPTDEEILNSVVQGGGAGLSKEQQEQLEKQKAEQEKIKAEQEKSKAEFDQMKKHFDAAVAFDAEKKYEEASAEYKQAATLDGTQHVVFANLSQALFNAGAIKFNSKDRTGAEKYFNESVENGEKAIQMNPTDASYKLITAKPLALLGQFYGKLDKADRAATLYKEAAELQTDPKEKGKLLVKAGESYFNAGQLDTAVTTYRSIIATDPNNVEALYGLGLAMVADPSPAKQQEAIGLFEQVATKATDTKLKTDAAELAKQLKEASKPTKRK